MKAFFKMVAGFFGRMGQTEWDRVHAAVGPLPPVRPRDLFYGSQAAVEARSKHLQPSFEPSSPDDFEAVARAVEEAEARAHREAVNRGVFPFAWAHLNRLGAPAERSYLLWYLKVMSVWEARRTAERRAVISNLGATAEGAHADDELEMDLLLADLHDAEYQSKVKFARRLLTATAAQRAEATVH